MHPVANGIKEEDHRQDKEEREEWGPHKLEPTEGQIRQRNEQGIRSCDCAGGEDIPIGTLDDGVDFEEVVLHDRVTDKQRKDDEKGEVIVETWHEVHAKNGVDHKIEQGNRSTNGSP